MQDYLILKLHGALQAWGTHTYEDYRPSNIFPTRSAVVGLLGACLGIDRDDIEARQALNASFKLTVRADNRKDRENNDISTIRITDYHTVLNARKVDGSPRKDAIVSQREYLCDAEFTLALSFDADAKYTLNNIKEHLKKPKYTPFLGRKSCPIQKPLLPISEEQHVITADSAELALQKIEPFSGTIYSEIEIPGSSPMRMRDVPMPSEVRQFATRWVYIKREGGNNVSE